MLDSEWTIHCGLSLDLLNLTWKDIKLIWKFQVVREFWDLGYIWFSAKNFGGIAICKSRDTEIATGSCLSWNANFCWFQNAIPQISPSQTFPDFCDLLNERLALSRRLNKRALNIKGVVTRCHKYFHNY